MRCPPKRKARSDEVGSVGKEEYSVLTSGDGVILTDPSLAPSQAIMSHADGNDDYIVRYEEAPNGGGQEKVDLRELHRTRHDSRPWSGSS